MTTTGFDLDMTLIDSRPGIRAVYDQLVAESGVPIDTGLVVTRLGPPVEWELAQWMPEDDAARWANRYRELYPLIAVDLVEAMPGAHEAVEAARSRGRTILVGDHVHDMEAATLASATGLGVATGPCSADELLTAGADHVLASLTDLPNWLSQHA